MKLSEINNSISTLPGVGPAKAALFANLNIFTVGELLQFYPRDYEDRTEKSTIGQSLKSGTHKVHTIAQIVAHEWFGYGRMRTLKLIINDGSGTGELIAFNRPFLEKSHPIGSIIGVTGKFEIKYGKFQSSSFDIEKIAPSGNIKDFLEEPVPNSKVFPIYHLTEGLTNKIITKIMEAAFAQYSIGLENDVPKSVSEKKNLLSKKDSLRKIHFPSNIQEVIEARQTLVYEELFNFQTAIANQALSNRGELPKIETSFKEQKKYSKEEFEYSLSPRQKQLLSRLSFSLTEDQISVITQMNYDIDRNYENLKDETKRPFAMRTLLQGDVGSGKTLVSFFACLRVIDYGSQCALMAPTELLARQHAENAAKLLESLGVAVAYLTGNIKSKGRENLLSALKKGEINLVIGTHALFSKNVVYKDLALAIIDEQHRFGVVQRAAILNKGRQSTDSLTREPNLLMMSATPIPQTLALTVFGDLDVLSIHTMPNGRKPITTYLVKGGNEMKAYMEVRKELSAGHQAYFVYPAIEQNFDSEDFSESPQTNLLQQKKEPLKSAEEMYTFLSEQVFRDFKVGLIHSKVAEEDQSRILEDFRTNKIQILVATTVVEVGVDVPNATCMVIEQADRFGLAALHQLRGRVGRGSDQSFCFLIYRQNITENGIERMKAIRETTDGFKIAEEDLKLRGPGEITGTAQSGELTFKIADPIRDEKIMMEARKDAFEALK